MGVSYPSGVDLVLAIKNLDRAKTRLRGVSCDHEALALAIGTDTMETAATTESVRSVLVVSSDDAVRAGANELGIDVVPDPGAGLNAALRHGFAVLRARDANSVIGALQSDLPALRGTELGAALTEAAGGRAYCADRHGTGTSLLLSTPGGALDPRFGEGSAAAHEATGARPLRAALPGLRTDVDTAADLELARGLGVGKRTAAALFTESSCGGQLDIS
ncbi:2-phospho-L-lactate guanylyltransferase [Sciscionella sediminilitoris]|uniref:2-phospho-L-lactate guanylyltransferase n=1 Tax=Sciscionella sediminilitoris TaxID=1445613 RepID=UPI0004DF9029|nr:2-phospho-L-lactate guanylyltransferase [Sciscionella sp. SE31]